MANLKTGSSGSDVKKLQQALVDAGYNVGSTGVDGVFGKNTAAAVKQYQKDNGLAVDGIAGKNTLGALYGSGTTKTTTGTKAETTASTNKTAQTSDSSASATQNSSASNGKDIGKGSTVLGTAPFQYEDFTYQAYAPSDVVNQANAMLQEHQNAKPGAYQSQWQDEIYDYLGQIQNREEFSYDFNSDALYQQMKDSYIQQGQMAMMDTMGQAAAMTGGYGNSYAQTVGQQAYNQQLNQLNDAMPELYQMAYNRYADEGQRLTDNLNMYMGLENQDYNRYQTDLGNWYNQLQYLTGVYESERDLDLKQYTSNRELAYNDYATNKEIAYSEHDAEQDRVWNEYLAGKDDEQTAAEIMAGAGDYDRLKEIYGLSDEEVAALKKANTKSSSSGSSKKTETYKVLSDEQLKNFDKAIQAGTFSDEYIIADYAYRYGVDPAYLEDRLAAIKGANEDPLPTGVPTPTKEAATPLYSTGGLLGKGVYDPISGRYLTTKQ